MAERKKPILGKVIINGQIECKTGLHIGGSDASLSIGGMDNPVIRDPITNEPYIPGSSLKGKLRSLLERALNKDFNKSGGKNIFRHECSDPSCEVCRLFGASGGDANLPSRLQFRDSFLADDSREELLKIDEGLPFTEWKTENSLDRITCAANPRPIERVPAGSKFNFEIVYTVENKEDVNKDLRNLMAVMDLLMDDALGGGGSRGSGRVEMNVTSIKVRPISYYIESKGEKEIRVEKDDRVASMSEVLRFLNPDAAFNNEVTEKNDDESDAS